MKEVDLAKLPIDRLTTYLGHAPASEWSTMLWKYALRAGSVRREGSDPSLKAVVELSSVVSATDEQIAKFGLEDIICLRAEDTV